MDYKLAKMLKDAGFPQSGNFGQKYIQPNGIIFQSKGDDYPVEILQHDDAKIPTLSELIEAVKTHPMNRKDIGFYISSDGCVAWARKTRLDDEGDGDRDCEGSTPEEAVANLWLELSKE